MARAIRTRPGNAANRQGTEPRIGEVILTKASDGSSVGLFSNATSGRRGTTTMIHLVTSGNPGDTYLEYTLSDTLIAGYAQSAATGRPVERIVLSFTRIEMRYTPYDSLNNPQPPLVASYDLATTKFA